MEQQTNRIDEDHLVNVFSVRGACGGEKVRSDERERQETRTERSIFSNTVVVG